jgi:hypothetical protein
VRGACPFLFSRRYRDISGQLAIHSCRNNYLAPKQVETTLYRVHRYFFERDSAIFASMFTLPSAAGERPEGEVVENPIVLEGVNTLDFDRFLSVLYPMWVYIRALPKLICRSPTT